jgi:uncharacterized SAM-binding protein YcdF (DUF218 family)
VPSYEPDVVRGSPERSEASAVAELLVTFQLSPSRLYLEERSQNTLQNVTFNQAVLERLAPRRLGVVCHSYAARRSWVTARTFLREIEVLVFPFDVVVPDDHGTMNEISETTWSTSHLGRSLVYGEYQRIGLYSGRDILLDHETASLKQEVDVALARVA